MVLPYERDRGRLAALYAAADFYLAPGPGRDLRPIHRRRSGFRLPVLCVARGAGPDRWPVRHRELYAHGQPASAAQAMARLIDRLSPELSREARIHAEVTLRWEDTFRRLVDLYEALARRGAD